MYQFAKKNVHIVALSQLFLFCNYFKCLNMSTEEKVECVVDSKELELPKDGKFCKIDNPRERTHMPNIRDRTQ